MLNQGWCFSKKQATLSRPVAVDEETFAAAARNSSGEKGSRKRNETPYGMWLGKAQTGNLWLGDRKVGSSVVNED